MLHLSFLSFFLFPKVYREISKAHVSRSNLERKGGGKKLEFPRHRLWREE